MKYYKIACEFYVKADDYKSVEKYLAEEAGEFADQHLIIEEVKPEDVDEIYEDLGKNDE